jgi:hypothetical protein
MLFAVMLFAVMLFAVMLFAVMLFAVPPALRVGANRSDLASESDGNPDWFAQAAFGHAAGRPPSMRQ